MHARDSEKWEIPQTLQKVCQKIFSFLACSGDWNKHPDTPPRSKVKGCSFLDGNILQLSTAKQKHSRLGIRCARMQTWSWRSPSLRCFCQILWLCFSMTKIDAHYYSIVWPCHVHKTNVYIYICNLLQFMCGHHVVSLKYKDISFEAFQNPGSRRFQIHSLSFCGTSTTT